MADISDRWYDDLLSITRADKGEYRNVKRNGRSRCTVQFFDKKTGSVYLDQGDLVFCTYLADLNEIKEALGIPVHELYSMLTLALDFPSLGLDEDNVLFYSYILDGRLYSKDALKLRLRRMAYLLRDYDKTLDTVIRQLGGE